jgi:Domain of unknown function (DUF3846)
VTRKNIRVLVYEPGKEPEERTIPNNLEALQGIVGGDIEVVSLSRSLKLICNEEGRLRGLPPNRVVPHFGAICGTFLVAGQRGADLCSLVDLEIEVLRGAIREEAHGK